MQRWWWSSQFCFYSLLVFFQKYFVPQNCRTNFYRTSGYEWIMSAVLHRSDTTLAQGLSWWSHAWNGLCAARSDEEIYAIDKRKTGVFCLLKLCVLLTATGTRSKFYAVAIAFLFCCVWSKKWLTCCILVSQPLWQTCFMSFILVLMPLCFLQVMCPNIRLRMRPAWNVFELCSAIC